MEETITDFSQVTPQWLTERLRCRGHLERGEVTEARVESSARSEVARLRVWYSNSAIDLPTRFFLKIGGEDKCVDREALFHRDMVSLMDDSPTVRWFDVAYDSETLRAHLLSEDVSRTHYHGDWSVSPSLRADSERIVDKLSRFHAYWWHHPRLGTEFGDFPREDNILFFHGVAGYEKSLARVIDMVGDRITPERRATYEQALESYPFKDLQGQKRLTPGNRLTVIHGDVLPDNVLLPRNPSVHTMYLIDWAFWEIRVGTDDVANIGLLGFCDPKADLTRGLVHRYYDGLLQYGVQGYRWEDCWHDYRLSTIRNLFIPINSFRDTDYSWKNLERSLQSFHDLNCAELLGSQ